MRDKMKSLDLLGLFKFSITILFLLHYMMISFENALALNSTTMILSFVVLFVLSLVGITNEFRDVQIHDYDISNQFPMNDKIKIIFFLTMASFLTYLVQAIFNQNSLFAGSIVALLMVYLIPQTFDSFEITVYTGTIAGMAGTQFISNWQLALGFGFLSSIFYLFLQPSYRATGGRAGLITYMSTLVFMHIILDWRPETGTQIEPNMMLISFMTFFAGAYITYLLHMNDILSVVKSAALVTLIFDLIFPQSLHLYTTAAYVGTIVAMTTPSKTKNMPFLSLITFFSFLSFVLVYPLMLGTTGKLGLVALIGYLAADGASILVEKLSRKNKNKIFSEFVSFFI